MVVSKNHLYCQQTFCRHFFSTGTQVESFQFLDRCLAGARLHKFPRLPSANLGKKQEKLVWAKFRHPNFLVPLPPYVQKCPKFINPSLLKLQTSFMDGPLFWLSFDNFIDLIWIDNFILSKFKTINWLLREAMSIWRLLFDDFFNILL